MNKFWKWITNELEQERELRIDGVIGDGDTWFEDSVNPKMFRDELNAGKGKVKLWLNSFGGDVFAASQIYTMLKEYQDGVDVYIDGIAASAASVIAMAGGVISMAPTSLLMLHDPSTFAAGNTEEFKAAIKMLDEIKESIINAYELKTKLPREKISKMMTAETWLDAKKAVELGFADKILYTENDVEDSGEGLIYSRAAVTNSLFEKIKRRSFNKKLDGEQFYKRLNLLAP